MQVFTYLSLLARVSFGDRGGEGDGDLIPKYDSFPFGVGRAETHSW